MKGPMKLAALTLTALPLLLADAGRSNAGTINLLQNPGFETGTFSSWTIAGNSTETGVGTDGALIPIADFPPNNVTVRSGNYAGFALVKEYPTADRIILTQTVSVPANQTATVGFYLADHSASSVGMYINDDDTQIFIDGVGLLPTGYQVLYAGSGPGSFNLVSGSFNTGSRTSISVAFAIAASGSGRVGVSFDDFFLNVDSAVPEPASVALLGIGSASLLGYRWRKRKA